MDGILLVDKPVGWTSHDVVAKVRGIIKTQSGQKIKIGHTGTLDPVATGLMILVLGKYTKRAGEFSKLDKTYEAEITLGKTSSTGDSEGEITDESTKKPTLEEANAALTGFSGEIEQTPPIYSAIKIDGQRAYKMARKGEKPVLEPRKVTIYEISVLDYKYPKLQIKTHVSSGTYIRSLAEDIGAKLGTGAYLSALRRTSVGTFKIEGSLPLEGLTSDKIRQGLPDHP